MATSYVYYDRYGTTPDLTDSRGLGMDLILMGNANDGGSVDSSRVVATNVTGKFTNGKKGVDPGKPNLFYMSSASATVTVGGDYNKYNDLNYTAEANYVLQDNKGTDYTTKDVAKYKIAVDDISRFNLYIAAYSGRRKNSKSERVSGQATDAIDQDISAVTGSKDLELNFISQTGAPVTVDAEVSDSNINTFVYSHAYVDYKKTVTSAASYTVYNLCAVGYDAKGQITLNSDLIGKVYTRVLNSELLGVGERDGDKTVYYNTIAKADAVAFRAADDIFLRNGFEATLEQVSYGNLFSAAAAEKEEDAIDGNTMSAKGLSSGADITANYGVWGGTICSQSARNVILVKGLDKPVEKEVIKAEPDPNDKNDDKKEEEKKPLYEPYPFSAKDVDGNTYVESDCYGADGYGFEKDEDGKTNDEVYKNTTSFLKNVAYVEYGNYRAEKLLEDDEGNKYDDHKTAVYGVVPTPESYNRKLVVVTNSCFDAIGIDAPDGTISIAHMGDGGKIQTLSGGNKLMAESQDKEIKDSATVNNNSFSAIGIRGETVKLGYVSNGYEIESQSTGNVIYAAGTSVSFNENKINAIGIEADTIELKRFEGIIKILNEANRGYAYNTTGSSSVLYAMGMYATKITAADNLGGTITVTCHDNESQTEGKYAGIPFTINTAGIHAKTLTVSGKIDTGISIDASENKSGIVGGEGGDYGAYINWGIKSTTITADAVSGTINVKSNEDYAPAVGIQAEEIRTSNSNDVLDISGEIYVSGLRDAVGVISKDALNLRVSGTITSTSKEGSINANKAILAEGWYTDSGLWYHNNDAAGTYNDTVELADGAQITGAIDLRRGQNTIVINSGAHVDGALMATDGLLNVRFDLDRILEENKPIVETDFDDISLASLSMVFVNLNNAKKGTYTLYTYNKVSVEVITGYWTDRGATFSYQGGSDELIMAYLGNNDKRGELHSVAGVSFYFYQSNNSIIVEVEENANDPAPVTIAAKSFNYTKDYDDAHNTMTLNWTETAETLSEYYEIEYRINSSEDSKQTIILKVSGKEGKLVTDAATGKTYYDFSAVLSGINQGDDVDWRIRRYADKGQVTGTWTEWKSTIYTPKEENKVTGGKYYGKEVNLWTDKADLKLVLESANMLAVNPDKDGAGINNARALLLWGEAEAETTGAPDTNETRVISAGEESVAQYHVRYFTGQAPETGSTTQSGQATDADAVWKAWDIYEAWNTPQQQKAKAAWDAWKANATSAGNAQIALNAGNAYNAKNAWDKWNISDTVRYREAWEAKTAKNMYCGQEGDNARAAQDAGEAWTLWNSDSAADAKAAMDAKTALDTWNDAVAAQIALNAQKAWVTWNSGITADAKAAQAANEAFEAFENNNKNEGTVPHKGAIYKIEEIDDGTFKITVNGSKNSYIVNAAGTVMSFGDVTYTRKVDENKIASITFKKTYSVSKTTVTVDGVPYEVNKNTVTINGKPYTVKDGKVTIGGNATYTFANGTEEASMIYNVADGKVTIYGKEYTVDKDGKVTIDGGNATDVVYTLTVGEKSGKVENGTATIYGVTYTVDKQTGKITKAEYTENGGTADIPEKYEVTGELTINASYTGTESITLDGKTYTISGNKITVDKTTYYIEDEGAQIYLGNAVYTVTNGKITSGDVTYDFNKNEITAGDVTYKISGKNIISASDSGAVVTYTVNENNITVNMAYEVKDGIVTIDGMEYVVDGDEITAARYTIEDDKVTIEGVVYAVSNGKLYRDDYTVENGSVMVPVEGEYYVYGGYVTIGDKSAAVQNGRATINNATYIVEDGKVVARLYDVEGGTVEFDDVTYTVENDKIYRDDYKVDSGKVVVNGNYFAMEQVSPDGETVTFEVGCYKVNGESITYDELDKNTTYNFTDNKITVDNTEYTIDGNEITVTIKGTSSTYVIGNNGGTVSLGKDTTYTIGEDGITIDGVTYDFDKKKITVDGVTYSWTEETITSDNGEQVVSYNISDGKQYLASETYKVIDGKVNVHGVSYDVKGGKVTIGEYENEPVTDDDTVTINIDGVDVKYTVKNGKVENGIYKVTKNADDKDVVIIDDRSYDVKNDKITVDGKSYEVKEGDNGTKTVTVPVSEEYYVVGGEVTIDGKSYHVKNGEITVPFTDTDFGKECNVDTTGKKTLNDVTYDFANGSITIGKVICYVKDNQVSLENVIYTVGKDNYTITVDGKDYLVYEEGGTKVAVDGVAYTVNGNKITVDGVCHTVNSTENTVTDEVNNKTYTATDDGEISYDNAIFDFTNNTIKINGKIYEVADGEISINGISYNCMKSTVTVDEVSYSVTTKGGVTEIEVDGKTYAINRDDNSVTVDDVTYTIYEKVTSATEVLISRLNNQGYVYWQVKAESSDVSETGDSEWTSGQVFRVWDGDSVSPEWANAYPTKAVAQTDGDKFKVTISWGVATDDQSGINYYRVEYWSDDADSRKSGNYIVTPENYKSEPVGSNGNMEKVYTATITLDRNEEDEGTYRYQITAVDYTGNATEVESKYSGSFNVQLSPVADFAKLSANVLGTWKTIPAGVDENGSEVPETKELSGASVELLWKDSFTATDKESSNHVSNVKYYIYVADNANLSNAYVFELDGDDKRISVDKNDISKFVLDKDFDTPVSILSGMSTVYYQVRVAYKSDYNDPGTYSDIDNKYVAKSEVYSFAMTDSQTGDQVLIDPADVTITGMTAKAENVGEDGKNLCRVTFSWNHVSSAYGVWSYTLVVREKDESGNGNGKILLSEEIFVDTPNDLTASGTVYNSNKISYYVDGKFTNGNYEWEVIPNFSQTDSNSTAVAGADLNVRIIAPEFQKDEATSSVVFDVKIPSKEKFQITWSAAKAYDGSAVSYYEIYYKQKDSDTWLVLSDKYTKTSYTGTFPIQNLAADEYAYNFKVVAVDKYNNKSTLTSTVVLADVCADPVTDTPTISGTSQTENVFTEYYYWEATHSTGGSLLQLDKNGEVASAQFWSEKQSSSNSEYVGMGDTGDTFKLDATFKDKDGKVKPIKNGDLYLDIETDTALTISVVAIDGASSTVIGTISVKAGRSLIQYNMNYQEDHSSYQLVVNAPSTLATYKFHSMEIYAIPTKASEDEDDSSYKAEKFEKGKPDQTIGTEDISDATSSTQAIEKTLLRNGYLVGAAVDNQNLADTTYLSIANPGVYNFTLTGASTPLTMTIYKVTAWNDDNNTVKSVSTVKTVKLTPKYDTATKTWVSSVSTGDLLLDDDKEGDYFITVSLSKSSARQNVDSYYTLEVSGTEFTRVNNEDDLWYEKDSTYNKYNKIAGDPIEVTGSTVNSEDSSCTDKLGVVYNEWVGFGDAADYHRLTIDGDELKAGKYSFALTTDSDSPVTITIYKATAKAANANDTIAKVAATITTTKETDNAGNTTYTYSTNALLLDDGDYYVYVQAKNAAKGENLDYTLTVSGIENSMANKADDNFLDTNKVLQKGLVEITASGNDRKFDTNIKPYDAIGDYSLKEVVYSQKVSEWVGFGDSKDCYTFTSPDNGVYTFTLTGLDQAVSVKMTVYEYNRTTNKYTSKVTVTGTEGLATKSLALHDDLTYVVVVESVNAAKGMNTDYDLTVTGKLYPEHNDDTFDTAQRFKVTNYDANVKQVVGWVGYGDETSYNKLDTDGDGSYSVSITGTDTDVKYNIVCRTVTVTTTYNANGSVKKENTTYGTESKMWEKDKTTSKKKATVEVIRETACSNEVDNDDGTYSVTKTYNEYYVVISAKDAKDTSNTAFTINAKYETPNDAMAVANALNNVDVNAAAANDGGVAIDFNDGDKTLSVADGNKTDYKIFTLDEAAILSLNLKSNGGASSFTIYQEVATTDKNGNVTYSLKKIQSTSVKANNTSTSKELYLGAGNYYIAVSTTQKTGDVTYDIEVNALKSKDLGAYDQLMLTNVGDTKGYGVAAGATDYTWFNATADGCYNFSLTEAADKVRLYVYAENGSGGLKQLKYVNAVKNADGTYSCNVSDLYLAEGNYYIAVKSLTKNDTGYNLSLGGEAYVDGNDNSDDNWKNLTDAEKIAAAGGDIVSGDWVGYYDKTDYHKFTVEETGKYDLSLGADLDNKVKVTIYEEQTNARGVKSLKTYKTIYVTADNAETALADLLLSSTKTYYVKVDVASAKNDTVYDLTLSQTQSIGAGESSADDNWKDLADTKAVAIGTTNNTIVSGDWVGSYDKTDYIKFTVDETGKYNLTFDTLDNNVKLTVYKEVTNAKGVTSLSTVKSAVTVTNKDLTVENLLLDSDTTYYVKVDAANASKDTAYTLTADFSRTRLIEDGEWTDADGVFDVQLDAKEAQSFEFSFDHDTEFDFDLDFADGVSCTLSKYVNGKETSLGSLNKLADDFTFEADVTYALSFTNTSKTASAEFDIVKEENKLCLTSAYIA